MSRDKADALELFGVDLSPFSEAQRKFLINARYVTVEAELCRLVGKNRKTITYWKKNTPGFKAALLAIRRGAAKADVEAAENPHIEAMRKQSKDILADAAPGAAAELVALAQKPWNKLSEREMSSKVKACEDILRIVGVEPKFVNADTNKVNVLAIIASLGHAGSGPSVEAIEAATAHKPEEPVDNA